MYRTPGRMFVPYKATSNMKQSIDSEAKTKILSNANGATEGAPLSKTIITGVANKTSITPLDKMTVGFDVVGEELPDIREMSHRDLLALEQKNNMDDDRKQNGRGLKLAGKGMGVVSFCAQKKRKTQKGKGMGVVSFCAQKGKGNRLAGGMYGRGDLPSTFYGEILPTLLSHLNIPAESKTIKRLMDITRRDYEKTQDTKRLIDMVTEDYAKMLVGDNMSGAGMRSLNTKIRSALVNAMNMNNMTGAGIRETFKKVIDTVQPYIKPAMEVGKFVWRNRDTIRDIASLVL